MWKVRSYRHFPLHVMSTVTDNFHKITLAGKLCKNLDNEFDENPAKGLIADTGSEANERTDRRADIV